MRVLLTGANGQLGQALQHTAPAQAELTALDRQALDLTDRQAVTAAVGDLRPQWVINAAAYTAVDRAEDEPEQAARVNTDAVGWLAEAAAATGARLVHISTDYVFDGRACRPYRPDDPTNPLSVYGRTKLEGERRARAALGGRALVVRTAWLYGAHGHNFLNTMLRLMRERDELAVVADQVGTPTSTPTLARAVWTAVVGGQGGTAHYTDAGVASWYDFAVAIGEEARARELIETMPVIRPIPASEYPTPAARPDYSVLACDETLFGRRLHWREALRQVLAGKTESAP